jgi:hypothetical protein
MGFPLEPLMVDCIAVIFTKEVQEMTSCLPRNQFQWTYRVLLNHLRKEIEPLYA